MIHPEISDIFTVRSVFVIGPDKKVKLMITYPASTGRNFDEILRVIDSLQLTAKYSVATPVNWKDGDDVIIVPSMSDEAAKEKFPAAGERRSPICESRRNQTSSRPAATPQQRPPYSTSSLGPVGSPPPWDRRRLACMVSQ